MLTPQEVSTHSFSKASFGGYNMAMVDEYLDLLTADYTTLYKENATLKAKMKVLVDTVEEYRSTEEAMRKALLTAQKMADELVAQAEAKAKEVRRSANEYCEDVLRRTEEALAEAHGEMRQVRSRFRSAVGGPSSAPAQGGSSRMYDAEADE